MAVIFTGDRNLCQLTVKQTNNTADMAKKNIFQTSLHSIPLLEHAVHVKYIPRDDSSSFKNQKLSKLVFIFRF